MRKSWLVVAFLSLFICLSRGYRVARETEREGGRDNRNNESNDVNSRRDSETTNQDVPAPGIDSDDDEWDDENMGEGVFLSWNPFRNSMQDFIQEMIRMQELMREVHQRVLNMTSQLPENYNNSTSEIVEINGKRYKLQRTVINKGDNNTSFFVSATSLVPADRRRKREALTMESVAEKLHRMRRDTRDEDESDSEGDDG